MLRKFFFQKPNALLIVAVLTKFSRILWDSMEQLRLYNARLSPEKRQVRIQKYLWPNVEKLCTRAGHWKSSAPNIL